MFAWRWKRRCSLASTSYLLAVDEDMELYGHTGWQKMNLFELCASGAVLNDIKGLKRERLSMPLGAYLWTRETLLLNLCEMCSHDCLSMFQMSVLCKVSLLSPLSKQQTCTNAKHGFCSSSMAACDCIRPYGLWTPGVHLELIHYDTQWLCYRDRTCSKCPRCFCRVHNWLQVGDYIWWKFVTAITLLVTAYLKSFVWHGLNAEEDFCDKGECVHSLLSWKRQMDSHHMMF